MSFFLNILDRKKLYHCLIEFSVYTHGVMYKRIIIGESKGPIG